MDKFLEAYDLPILNQDEMNNFKRSIANNGIGAIFLIPTLDKQQKKKTLDQTPVEHRHKHSQ